MNVSFWMIFLSLMIGCVIGYEAGKYSATKKIQEFLDSVSEDMQKAAQKQKEETEKKRKEAMEAIEDLGRIFETMKKLKEHEATEDPEKEIKEDE